MTYTYTIDDDDDPPFAFFKNLDGVTDSELVQLMKERQKQLR